MNQLEFLELRKAVNLNFLEFDYAQSLKFSLGKFNTDLFNTVLSNPDYNIFSNRNYIAFHDIDFTQNFEG